jgi:hypothetical protein
MTEIKWRFPGNNYADESGLDTSDMETFKKDPISSLARELCQNSIDARRDETKPVHVVFSLYEIDQQSVPSRERLLKEVRSCETEWSYHRKISDQLKHIREAIEQPRVKSLRVSDFNTTGLTGIKDKRRGSFYLLTKGSGISDKTGTTGGSKGIGKYATFVASRFNTVFYNTQNTDGEVAYQGICKLCSTTIEGTDEKTQGIGYYGIGDKNEPVLENHSLDPSFSRKEPGTDIFILGFREEKTWMKEVISKILDSFMSAIVRDQLTVQVQDVMISSETLSGIIYQDDYIMKANQRDIVAQYQLLTDEHVIKETFDVNNYGDVELFIKTYDKDTRGNATNHCVMVRYPYMKIKVFKRIASIPFSAMCIIGDNDLNRKLRDIENPQHTDWEIKRIDDNSTRNEVKITIKELHDKITNIVIEAISSTDSEKTDIEGASDYLPDVEQNMDGDAAQAVVEAVTISKPKKNRVIERIGYEEDEYSAALQPEIGMIGEDDGPAVPYNPSEIREKNKSNEEENGGVDEGNTDYFKPTPLSGIKYSFIVLNKQKGQYAIIFHGISDESHCEMHVKYVDEGGNKYPVHIHKALLHNRSCQIENDTKVVFELFKDKEYRFILDTDQEDYFACEVKLYAFR